MSDIQKIIGYVVQNVGYLKDADRSTTVRTIAILETSLTAISRAVEVLPSYEHSNAINAILGIVERGETNES